MSEWTPEDMDADVAFTLSEIGQLRREDREIAYAREIVRLKAELADAIADIEMFIAKESYFS